MCDHIVISLIHLPSQLSLSLSPHKPLKQTPSSTHSSPHLRHPSALVSPNIPLTLLLSIRRNKRTDMGHLNPPQDTAMMMGMEKLNELPNWPHALSTQFISCPSSAAYYNSGGAGAPFSPSLFVDGAHAAPFSDEPEQHMRFSSPTAWELSFRESPRGQQHPAPVEAMREFIFRIAAMQPIHIDPESVKPPKRRNVRISKDPQSVAARHRRERISERIRILQRLVPGGTKLDTASMLEEAIHYMKFLRKQVQSLEQAAALNQHHFGGTSNAMSTTTASSTEERFPPDVNRISVGNYYEKIMSDRGFDMNTTTTTTHMFYN